MAPVLTLNLLPPPVNKATVHLAPYKTFIVLVFFLFLSFFKSGNIEAISLCDIYLGATGQMPINQSLQRKDPILEGLKKSNASFIHMNRYVLGIATRLC